MSQTNDNTGLAGFFDIFLSKLKEQSFIIVLMLCALYFQNRMFTQRIDKHEAVEDRQEAIIDKMIEENKKLYETREQYLKEQRDKYVDEYIDVLKNN
jgi:CO dehydrogenase/acetyl-CoA synthase beta subunit